MKIRYLQGPLTGQEKHVENSVGRFAIDSGLAEFVPPEQLAANRVHTLEEIAEGNPGTYVPPPASREPQWAVKKIGEDHPKLCVEMKIHNAVYYYIGDPSPKAANRKIGWPGCPEGGGTFVNGLGRAIPESVLKEYADQWKANPKLRAKPFTESSNVNSINEAAIQMAGGRFRPLAER